MTDRQKPKRYSREVQSDDLTPLSAFLPGIVGAMKLAPAPKALTVQGKHHHTTAKQINDLLEVR